MGDYHSWLDNIAAADMRASKYFVDKVQIFTQLIIFDARTRIGICHNWHKGHLCKKKLASGNIVKN